MRLTMGMLVVAVLAACGDGSDSDPTPDDCACAANQVCVVHFTDTSERFACVVAPAPCTGQPGDCTNTECVRAGYALCDEGFIGVGCSDTVAPPAFSCN